ncbi:MAG: TonB-dependent receptor plug domain-containing protein, partial [Ginsengibacter sp.]
MKILYCFLLLLFCGLALKAQQTNTVLRGKILSASTRTPVEGAVVSLQHSKKSVLSKSDGSFSIVISSPADSIIISHVSFQPQTVVVNTATTALLITLHESVTSMNDVVVSTGYQNIPKERATGSFVTVNPEQFNLRVAPDVISKLEGITSGLVFYKGTAGRPPELNIRGQSTLFSNSQPLIVVDNFPYEGDLNTINPNDVESITVLRDAAAASIWGVRAGNGVIVITTKKGGYNNPLQVSATGSVTIGQRPDLFYDRNSISPADFIDVETMLFSKGFYKTDLAARDMRAISPVVDILNLEKSGAITPAEATTRLDALKDIDTRSDLQKYFYRKSISQQYSINMQGGNDKVSYLFSAGCDDDLAGQVGNSSNRITLHTFDRFRPLKHLEISAGIDYIISRSVADNTLSQLSIGRGRTIYPYASLADAQ